jgi:hypothetical protein
MTDIPLSYDPFQFISEGVTAALILGVLVVLFLSITPRP